MRNLADNQTADMVEFLRTGEMRPSPPLPPYADKGAVDRFRRIVRANDAWARRQARMLQHNGNRQNRTFR